MGLREVKKQKIRKHISDIATKLFIKNGFRNVTIAEIADSAEVSLKTVFNYFPKKESLVFDIEEELDAEITTAVRERKKGESLLDGLFAYFTESRLFQTPDQGKVAEFWKLVSATPELAAYFREMMGRYENTLVELIREETQASKAEAQFLARFILEGVSLARNSPSQNEALKTAFSILKHGWDK